MTYVSPTHSNSGSGTDPLSTAAERGDDPFQLEQEKGRKIDVSPMAYGHPEDGLSVQEFIGKAGDGAPSDFN